MDCDENLTSDCGDLHQKTTLDPLVFWYNITAETTCYRYMNATPISAYTSIKQMSVSTGSFVSRFRGVLPQWPGQ